MGSNVGKPMGLLLRLCQETQLKKICINHFLDDDILKEWHHVCLRVSSRFEFRLGIHTKL